MDVQVTQEQHMKAFEWLEKYLEKKVFIFDVDDVSAMVEQVTMQKEYS